jgi:hypothetical protein
VFPNRLGDSCRFISQLFVIIEKRMAERVGEGWAELAGLEFP